MSCFDHHVSQGRRVCVVAALAFITCVANGQCNPELRPGPGANGFNNEVWTMTHWDPDGNGPMQPNLIAGGIFTTAGGQPANRIAAWDGSQWRALGTGLNNNVRALAVFPATNELIVCGDFTNAGGVAASGIAKWNGVSWSNLGTGANNIVQGATILPSGDLFITGSFTAVSGVATVRAARWDGLAWHQVANGVPAVSMLVKPDGTLYATGNYNSGTSPNVTSWAGPGAGVWTGVGGGLGGCFGGEQGDEIGLLSGGDLVVAGDFSSARPGCTVMRTVARWNGATWTEMYTSALSNAGVYAMHIAGNDDIFLGTGWTNIWPGAGATMFKWNTGTSGWDNLGYYFDSGGNPYIWDFEPIPSGGGFYVGGRLQSYTANNGQTWNPIGYIARYGAPTPLFTQHPADTTTCPGASIMLNVTTTGPAQITHAWYRNGTPLANVPNHIFGADTPTLLILNALPTDTATYTCVASNPCGSETSRAANVTIWQCDCLDFNNDTSLFDPQDIEAFLSVYSEGPCIPASATCNDIDFNNDGSLFDPCDIDSFLVVFSEGPCTACGL